MISQIGGGAGDQPATPATKIRTAASDQDRPKTIAASTLPVAVGEFFPPAGRRQLGAILVRRCPGCGHAHFHRGLRIATVDGEPRTGSCGTEYKVRCLPAQRIGGAA
jgi:hypothetical protein